VGDVALPERRNGRHAVAEPTRPAVPAMLVIRSGEIYDGPPYPLLDGLGPTTGWQGAPAAEDRNPSAAPMC
jgi:hypothetical protein